MHYIRSKANIHPYNCVPLVLDGESPGSLGDTTHTPNLTAWRSSRCVFILSLQELSPF